MSTTTVGGSVNGAFPERRLSPDLFQAATSTRSSALPQLHPGGVATLPDLPSADELIEESLQRCRRRFGRFGAAAEMKAERKALVAQSLGDLPSFHSGGRDASRVAAVRVGMAPPVARNMRAVAARLAKARQEEHDLRDEVVGGEAFHTAGAVGLGDDATGLGTELCMDYQRRCQIWADETKVVSGIFEELTLDNLPDLYDISDEEPMWEELRGAQGISDEGASIHNEPGSVCDGLEPASDCD